jgi:hypothetical protein
LVTALVLSVTLVQPALAHGGWSGDPAHLLEDALFSFGLPLLVLVVGGLAGAGLSVWFSRREAQNQAAGEPEGDEALSGQER